MDSLNQLKRLKSVKYFLKPRIEVMVYSTSEWLVGRMAWIRELKKDVVLLYEEPGQPLKPGREHMIPKFIERWF